MFDNEIDWVIQGRAQYAPQKTAAMQVFKQ